jgi:hypothetical protein
VCECKYYSYFRSLVVEFSYGTRKVFQSEFFHLLGYYAVYRGFHTDVLGLRIGPILKGQAVQDETDI